MIFFLKFLGAYLGYQIAGYLGAVSGFIIGYSLDAGFSTQLERRRFQRMAQANAMRQANEAFFQHTVALLGKLCAADGAVAKEESEAFDAILNRIFKLNRRQKKEAHTIFKNAQRTNSSFQFHAAQFHSFFQHQQEVLEGMLDMLMSLAVADRALTNIEEQLIRSAATIFAVPDDRYEQLLSRHVVIGNHAAPRVPNRHELHYFTLGCKPTDSVTDIKRQYRKLVSDYHPDKIISKELPPEFLELAHQKFRDIQAAYEALKRERGFT